MDWTPTKLAAAELDTPTETDIYAATGAVVVHNIVIHNFSAASRVITLFWYYGASLQFFKQTLPTLDTVIVSLPNEGVVLANGNKLRGMADGDDVNIFVAGSVGT